MGRTKIYPDSHFRYTTCHNANGTTYVVRYRNEWNKEKKRSEPKERIYVGSLNTSTGKVSFSKKFLEKYPEFAGQLYFYENNELVIKTEEETEALEEQRTSSCLDDIVSPLGSWICWHTALEHHILKDLKEVLEPEDADNLLKLAVYVFLSSNGALQIYQQWLPQQWLPSAQLLDSAQISRLLAKITDETIKKYFKLRFDRVRSFYKKLAEQKTLASNVRHLLALDSTCIHSYSETIEDAAYGHAKQRPDLKQINYTLGVDYLTGETVYALESEGSINDKALYSTVIADMLNANFDLTDTVFVTDRGYHSLYNVQQLINSELGYLTRVPLSEEGIKEKFRKYKASFSSSAFYLADVGLYCRTFTESWQQKMPVTEQTFTTTQYLHLYVNPELQTAQMKQLEAVVSEVLEKKNKGLTVEHSLYTQASPYIKEDEKRKVWIKKTKALDSVRCLKGAWAIRTNCIEDPSAAVRISRQRNVIEEAFRGFKVENSGDRLYSTKATYEGKLFLLSLAQSLRNIFLMNVRNFAQPLPEIEKYCQEQRKQNKVDLSESERRKVKLPGDSLRMAFASLSRHKAVRAPSGTNWIMKKPLPKKDRDLISLLGYPKPPRFFKLC